MNLNALKTNPKSETEGTWVDFSDSLKILVARIPNPKYEAELTKLLKGSRPLRKASLRRGLSAVQKAELERCTFTAVAKHVVLGWEGLTELSPETPPEGQERKEVPVQFTPERCLEIMTDPALKDFVSEIVKIAENPDNFREESNPAGN